MLRSYNSNDEKMDIGWVLEYTSHEEHIPLVYVAQGEEEVANVGPLPHTSHGPPFFCRLMASNNQEPPKKCSNLIAIALKME